MRLFINPRGPNGSGKTTLARGFLARTTKIISPLRYASGKFSGSVEKTKYLPIAQCEPGTAKPVLVLARYDLQQGGFDTEKDMDKTEAVVREVAGDPQYDGHLFFEGFILSKSGARWMTFANSMRSQGPGEMLWLFLLPPIIVAAERIKQRNGGKDVNMERLQNGLDCCESIRRRAKFVSEPRFIRVLDWQRSPEETFAETLSIIRELEAL